ncbi:MAG: response regulator transcription factor [Rhodocyclaceae bacterium]|nr:MAG: response regulator transcription factor [Rhodocyclaceae bacterium]
MGGNMIFAVVEDSRSQAEVLKALLRSEGHQVEVFADGASCLEALKSRSFDFFVIDWNLPDMGGDEVLRQVRERFGWEVPVVFCTARTDEEAASDILRMGADDYIPKPVRYMEFMARVHVLLRRRRPRQSLLQFGSIEIDLEGRRIRLGGAEVDLTQREFELAVILLRNVGRVLSREELLAGVWAREVDVDTRTVDTHASRLRKKLGLAGESGLMLSSVYGQGYRLDTVQAA